jgi:hypothetical protein
VKGHVSILDVYPSLYPDAAHYLAQPGHFTAPRLWRDDPATLWDSALSHGDPEPIYRWKYPARVSTTALLEGLAGRRQKVDYYLSIARIYSRRQIEVRVPAFYLPELDRSFGLEPVPVPDHGRARSSRRVSLGRREIPCPAPALFRWSPRVRSDGPGRTGGSRMRRIVVSSSCLKSAQVRSGQRRPLAMRREEPRQRALARDEARPR